MGPRFALLLALVGCGSTPSHHESTSGSTGTTTSGATGGGVTDGASVTSSSSSGSPGPADSSGETGAPGLDETLAELLAMQDVPVVPLQPPVPPPAELVALGEALFFDPILSGPQDVACATCHHPAWGASDGLSLTLGTGAVGTGPQRAEGRHPPFVPRHAQSLFNVGHPDFVRLFWDGRVQRADDGTLRTPAGAALLPGVSSPLAAQAMFPVLDRREMRGDDGNELAILPGDDPQAIWSALMSRLGAIDGYVELFAAAYPNRDFDTLTFADAANAIAAYETVAFSFPHAPWDDYLAGDLDAIDDAAKLGAILFYGGAGCAGCHSGPLLTDHDFHNTGVPQLGPGLPASAPLDHGRALVTGDAADRFRFRTPSLRNVAVSAPYMHDGAHLDYTAFLVHYADPTQSIVEFDPGVLHPDLVGTVQQSADHIAEITATLDEDLVLMPSFAGLSNIRAFLDALTDPAVATLPSIRPASVPSGLPVP